MMLYALAICGCCVAVIAPIPERTPDTEVTAPLADVTISPVLDLKPCDAALAGIPCVVATPDPMRLPVASETCIPDAESETPKLLRKPLSKPVCDEPLASTVPKLLRKPKTNADGVDELALTTPETDLKPLASTLCCGAIDAPDPAPVR